MKRIRRSAVQISALLSLALVAGGLQYQRAMNARSARLRPLARHIIATPIPSHPERAPLYEIAELQTPAPYAETHPTAINATGQIVGQLLAHPPTDGTTHSERTTRAFLWIQGRIQEIGTLSGGDSSAHAIGNSGQIVGASDGHPFRWAKGAMKELTSRASHNGVAMAINDSGHIVGRLSHNGGPPKAFLAIDGKIRYLGTLDGNESAALDINSHDQIVGYSSIGSSTDIRAFVWRDGAMNNLGTLGGSQSTATGINDQGIIVGYSRTEDDLATHACMWANGTLLDLGTRTGDRESRANDVNAFGQVVGYSISEQPGRGAFIYSRTMGIVDLSARIDATLGWELSNPVAINDAGQIVGTGARHGKPRSFLLTPIRGATTERRLR